MQDEERHRLVAWLAAEFEVQNGIDVSKDTSVIARLQQAAEHAAAAPEKYEVNLPFLATDETGPKHFHVVLDKKRIDDIIAGRERPPHVDRARRSPPPFVEEEAPESRRNSSSTLSVVLVLFFIAVVAASVAASFLSGSKHHEEHDGHGQEHKR